MTTGPSKKYLALCGGVGGAKLATGLADVLDPDALTIIVNTGDDFEHFGLLISPDVDSVLYALSGQNDTERGWGRRDERWTVMEELKALGADTWFQLGDRDLATHLVRRALLDEGKSLSSVTGTLATRLGIRCTVAPMADGPVRTIVETDEGAMDFQHYFVKHQCAPRARGFQFEGLATARASDAFLSALDDPDLAGIILCPSNPFVSIGPILALDGIRDRLCRSPVPVIAVSPIIGGAALKGPAAKMLAELGLEVSAAALVELYSDFLDGLVLDSVDQDLANDLRARTAVQVTDTIMRDRATRTALARGCIDFLDELERSS